MGRGHVAVLAAWAAAAAVLASTAAAAVVPARTVARGSVASTGGGAVAVLVRTQAEGARAAARMRPIDRARLLAVDYRSRAAVVVERGFPTCGYQVRIVRLVRAGARLRVDTAVSRPSPGTMVCQALTTAYDAVSVPRAAIAGVGRVMLRSGG